LDIQPSRDNSVLSSVLSLYHSEETIAGMSGNGTRSTGGAFRNLPYLETHLVDHCNLNCKGCFHFSPISKPFFADGDQMERDIRRLSELFDNITVFRFLGGEPLLFPDITRILKCSRSQFPRSNIRIVTNGILLPEMTTEFWETLGREKIGIDITQYPFPRIESDGIRKTAASYRIDLKITRKTHFYKIPLVFPGTVNQDIAFRSCRALSGSCPFLRNGKIYLCARLAMFDLPEETFDIRLPEVRDCIDIRKASGEEILRYTMRSVRWCRHCDVKNTSWFAWDKSRKEKDEWI
jgi:hypothetical protein